MNKESKRASVSQLNAVKMCSKFDCQVCDIVEPSFDQMYCNVCILIDVLSQSELSAGSIAWVVIFCYNQIQYPYHILKTPPSFNLFHFFSNGVFFFARIHCLHTHTQSSMKFFRLFIRNILHSVFSTRNN